MHEWTDEFIANAQQELVGMVQDWQYDYGADNRACSTMLLWMVQKLNPAARLDLGMVKGLDPLTDQHEDKERALMSSDGNERRDPSCLC